MSDTRERILEVSLELFSLRGTEAVSIRDICAQVGIKESSVYYHFKNKQAIVDEIYARFEARVNALMDELMGFQTRVFAALTGRADASYLAVKFYAPIHLYAQRWLLTGTLSEGDKAAFRSDAYRHVRRFFAELGVYRD